MDWPSSRVWAPETSFAEPALALATPDLALFTPSSRSEVPDARACAPEFTWLIAATRVVALLASEVVALRRVPRPESSCWAPVYRAVEPLTSCVEPSLALSRPSLRLEAPSASFSAPATRPSSPFRPSEICWAPESRPADSEVPLMPD